MDVAVMVELKQDAIVQVEWLDEHASLEDGLLCQTTTIGIFRVQSEDFIGLANHTNAVDGGELLIIERERVLSIEVRA